MIVRAWRLRLAGVAQSKFLEFLPAHKWQLCLTFWIKGGAVDQGPRPSHSRIFNSYSSSCSVLAILISSSAKQRKPSQLHFRPVRHRLQWIQMLKLNHRLISVTISTNKIRKRPGTLLIACRVSFLIVGRICVDLGQLPETC